jgi:hypothetical protein
MIIIKKNFSKSWRRKMKLRNKFLITSLISLAVALFGQFSYLIPSKIFQFKDGFANAGLGSLFMIFGLSFFLIFIALYINDFWMEIMDRNDKIARYKP